MTRILTQGTSKSFRQASTDDDKGSTTTSGKDGRAASSDQQTNHRAFVRPVLRFSARFFHDFLSEKERNEH